MEGKKKAILIAEEDGNITEIDLDIHPKKNEIVRHLKGTATFIGAIPEMDIVIMKCDKSPFDLMLNRNNLPPPFDDEVIRGPILMVRMDENSEHQDLTLPEVEPMLRGSKPLLSTSLPN